ncbi:MAG: P-loop NTPase, partial [Elusimicrobiales bacterium]|nr:P-loop NTPase [Elusimicrobiales bacterium]
ILPVDVYGIKFMSFHFFSNNMPIALRGSSISDAIKEIFCIVQWGYLDYLIVDMPPGFYDVAFDIMNFIKNFRVIAIKTPSKLSADVYDRMINIYKGKYDLIEIENMTQMEGDFKIRFDPSIDGAIGDINKIKNTIFYKDLKNIFDKYL